MIGWARLAPRCHLGWRFGAQAVHATLKIKFAQTVTLALSITESLDPIIMRVGVPVLQAAATTTQRRRRRPQQHTSFSRAVGRARRIPPLAADARARRGKDRRRLDSMVPPGRRVGVSVGAQGWPSLLTIAPAVGQRAWIRGTRRAGDDSPENLPSTYPVLCIWTFCVCSGSVERLAICHVDTAWAIRHVAGPPE